MTEKYDLTIIGAGGAGLAAGMYAGRLRLKTLILGATHGSELPVGGLITTTKMIENYPGFIKISGFELAKKLEEHAKAYDSVLIKQEKVEGITGKGPFAIETNKGNYESKVLIFATGNKLRKLPESVKGAKEFEKKGINYCALCDAPLYNDKVVAVIGGSDTAIKDALILAEYAKKVYIIYRKEKIRSEPINLEKVKANKKIEVITNTNITEVGGKSLIESITLDKSYKGKKELSVNAIFVAIGYEPLSELAKNIGVKTNEKGEIIINHEDCSTNIGGVFAAGDVTDKKFKQFIIGVADGCTAAHSAYEYLSKK